MNKINRRNFIKKTSLTGAAIASSPLFSSDGKTKNYITPVFSDLDILCTNDWWNRSENEIIDLNV